MLELKHLCYDVDDEAGHVDIVKDVSFTIPEHKFVVITGPNGGGKSTIAKIIAGVLRPTGGTILLDGEDITGLGITERAKAGISYALQQLKDVGLNDLDTLVHTIQDSSDKKYYLAPYQIKCLGRLLDGEYYYGSHFYSTEGYTAKITEALIEEVKSSPDDWALVMFDQHY